MTLFRQYGPDILVYDMGDGFYGVDVARVGWEYFDNQAEAIAYAESKV